MKKQLLLVVALIGVTSTGYCTIRDVDKIIKDHGVYNSPDEKKTAFTLPVTESQFVISTYQDVILPKEQIVSVTKQNPTQMGQSVLTNQTHDVKSLVLISSDRSTKRVELSDFENTEPRWLYKNRANFY